MKLYYSPGACSLASHLALLEAGLEFDLERVDLKTKLTESGADFNTINAKSYVPTLMLDGREIMTENVAVLDWIATQAPKLGLQGPLGRTRLLEALAFISTEIHKSFGPFFKGGSEEAKTAARKDISKRLHWFAERKTGKFLFGNEPTVADFYLFVMLRWAQKFSVAIPDALNTLPTRMMERPSVQSAIEFEETPTVQTRTG
jgi:glutathione S-transferase